MEVNGYRASGVSWETRGVVTYHGTRQGDQAPLLLREIRGAFAGTDELARAQRDYEISRSLDARIVARPLDLVPSPAGALMVFADEGLRPLHFLLHERRLGIPEVLKFAASAAGALEQVHAQSLIHKNLNDETVWLERTTGAVKLCGFSIASRTPHRGHQAVSRIEGALPFVAPEQTGRMNRSIDHRADHYSLGVLCYLALTGKLPFDSPDPLELIHCHLARRPQRPDALDGAIPAALANIVMKALAKAPEDRYQRARGLELDLEACLSQWLATGSMDGVSAGERDSVEAFQLPQTLYGRESELGLLMTAFGRTAQGSTEVLLVSGAPGIGKSALVNEIHRPIVRSRGYFLSGKFDQYKRNIPYSAIVQAFQDLVAQILSEPEERVTVWRNRLLESLRGQGQVVVDVIPEVALLIGVQGAVPELPTIETRNRFVRVFRDFIRVFTAQDHPLVLFLDDLQWADSASLALIQAVLTDPATNCLLLIGAYRDNEVSPAHPLMLMMERVREDVKTSDVCLQGLEAEHIERFVLDTFHAPAERSGGLAELVHQKTAGNPFFVSQFLRFLLTERLVEAASGGWSWDLTKIRERGITDNVVELMQSKLANLSEGTKDVLRCAACIGNSFDLGTLRLVTGQTQATIGAGLRQALAEGLVLTPADGYALADDPFQIELPDGVVFRFLHDRIQHAAYSLIAESERPALHLRIGQLLRSTLSGAALEDALFVIVNHLDAGAELLENSAEARRDLAALNLKAARKARESTAYAGALEYLKTGLRLLPEDAWESDYRLSYEIHTEWMECEYQVGHPEEADRVFNVLLARVSAKLERAQIYYTKILVATNRNRPEEAMALGVDALKSFHINLPLKPSPAHLMLEVGEVTLRIRGREADTLLDKPALEDTQARWALRLLVSICPAAYFAEPNLMALAALRIVNMTLRYGNAPESPYGYILYALVLGAKFGNYERGHAFGRLAVAMSARDNDVLLRCKVFFIFAGLVNVWVRPVDDSLQRVHESYQLSLDVGDIQYATYSLQFALQLMIFRGTPLQRILEECERHRVFTNQTRDVITITTLQFRRQWALALRGETRAGHQLTSANFDEQEEVLSARQSGNLTSVAYYLIPKLQLCYLFGEHELAQQLAEESALSLEGVLSQVLETDHHFYVALNAVALERARPQSERRVPAILRKSLQRFRKWAAIQADNFQQQQLILEAETAALSGDDSEAMRWYDAAIEAAGKHRMLHLEALANELSGRYQLSKRREQIGRAYLTQAASLYAQWGALAKMRQLVQGAGIPSPVVPGQELSEQDERRGADLVDLDAVMRANQAIAGEVEMGRLLDKLMLIVLQNAGAQSACVVLEQDGELRVEASGSSDAAEFSSRSCALSDYPDAFLPVINYVARTRKDLVIDDARSDARFEASAYVIERALKSVLCCPVIKQGQFFGVLYMENNLTTGAFTQARIQTLRMIASEVASAVENARLYGQLKRNNRALQQALDKVDLLEKAKAHLTKFVPQSVRRIIEENPTAPALEKQDRDVSVLFLDIEGYTTLSEQLDQGAVDYLIERYFSSFLDDIHANGGDINETAGDGLMIIFQHESAAEHALCAARTALAVLAKTTSINRDLPPPYRPVRVNIGINSGMAAVGSSRFEGITGTRYTYTASGAVTNVAARLGAKATDGSILVSEETARRIRGAFELEDLGQQALKNVAGPVQIFRLLAARSP